MEFDGLELRTFDWHVDPLSIEKVGSSYFENEDVFPKGSVEFDCACCATRWDTSRFLTKELTELKNAAEATISKYGSTFEGDYGWATEALGIDRPTFTQIEESDTSEIRLSDQPTLGERAERDRREQREP